MWSEVLGCNALITAISFAQIDQFCSDRLSGTIDARGLPVDPTHRRTVSLRVVQADLQWLKSVFAWAMKWKTPDGQYLTTENPLRGYEVPREKNPRRPIATHDRFEKIRAVADQPRMEIIRDRHRFQVRTYLPEILDLANGTGRRIRAILSLRFSDLRPDLGPHGSIHWPASTDKMARASVVPLGPEARAAIDRVLSERPGRGDALLFPAPKDPSKPVNYELASKWLREAEALAGVAKQDGGLWHPFRRKWATERKGLSDIDVAAAGGWNSVRTLVELYQQPNHHSMLHVVTSGNELRETVDGSSLRGDSRP